MFSQVSVCPQVGCLPHPTPDTPPLGRHPLADTSLGHTAPGQTAPGQISPAQCILGYTPAPVDTMGYGQQAAGKHMNFY